MARMNDEVAAVLQEYADLMAITGGDAFRVRNYEKAARSVGGYPEDISQLDETGLRQIPMWAPRSRRRSRSSCGPG